MPDVVRPYRGVTADARRAERRDRLLGSCLDLVARAGISAVTVDAICTDATLSKRYFYESFADRDAILVAALDDVFVSVGSALREQLRDHGSTEDRVAHTATALVRALTTDPRAAHLYTAAAGNAALDARRRHIVDEFTPLLVKEVLGADPDDRHAVAATVLMVAGTTELLDRWLRGTLAFTETDFIDTLTRLGRTLAGSLQPSG